MASKGGFAGRQLGGQFNRQYNLSKQIFGIGNIDFLDGETSRVERYWRAIEHGTGRGFEHAPSQLRRVIGGGWAGPGGGRGARWGQDLSPFGEGDQQQFIPYGPQRDFESVLRSARRARQLIVAQDPGQWARRAGKKKPGPSTLGLIQKEIEPHNVYARALAVFDLATEETAVVSKLLGELLAAGKGSSTQRSLAEFPGLISVRVISDVSVSALKAASTRFNNQLLEANRRLARRLQQVAADELELVRPGASSGHLKEAILDPRNRVPE